MPIKCGVDLADAGFTLSYNVICQMDYTVSTALFMVTLPLFAVVLNTAEDTNAIMLNFGVKHSNKVCYRYLLSRSYRRSVIGATDVSTLELQTSRLYWRCKRPAYVI